MTSLRYEDEINVIAPVESFKTLSDRFRAANMMPDEAGLSMIPNTEMELSVGRYASSRAYD